ncbi:pre-mRNA 3'-end-processing factor FIP1 isoform X2 [Thunnus albacares]|uniref:pre-mRNA 3'-end-processing factor FIP1 isoform X2 n=1 Tax=Thunnus albacares TaxID=8236 RepID=UPI001CF6192B|nr:pre-mRNA 3'-end-processing factor FIP1 isoform X2 [Thunnus albacares]
MAALDSNPKDKVEEEEEEKIYQLIYNMDSTDNMEEEEEVSSSPEQTPVYLDIDSRRRPHAVASSTKRVDMDALDSILGVPVLEVNIDSLEEKPWRRAGADISDYFNYGFDEESWKAYCKKQAKHRAAHRKKAHTKITVQEGHNRHGKEEPCCSYSCSDSRSVLAPRVSSAAIEVTGGQPGSSSRVKVSPSLSNEEGNAQVVTEMSPEENRFTSFQQPPSLSFTPIFPYTPPPRFLFLQEGPSLFNIAALDSGLSKGFDDPSTSLYPYSSGVSSAIPGSRASSAEMIDTAKAWECHIWQDMEEKYDKDSNRHKEHGHDKDSKRGRDRERQSCPSHNSWEERMRHWDTVERGHKRHSLERFSVEKEERHRERRHRDTSEGRKKLSCSSRSRRDDGEIRDSQGRHKHKKAKRNKKNKESNKMFSTD